jgi:glycosyltransferase involved in cell wall biosynthesis
MKDKVSIIIPAFNASKLIVETLDSAIAQLHKNIEIIIIDDCSTDQTWNIIKTYSQKFPDIVSVYKNKRKGACAARNYGFELSSGDYIQYLDADDILSEDKLSREVELLMSSKDPKSIAFSKWHHFDTVLEDYIVNNQLVFRDYSPAYKILIDMWTQGEMIQTSCWLTPRTIIESIDGWNEEFKSNPTDDSEFFARVLLKCSKIVFDIQGIVYYRRPKKENLSQNFNKDAVESILKSYKSYESILVLNSSELVKRALAHNYLNFIHGYYSKYPRLIIQSEQHFHGLGFKKMWPVGGYRFKKMAKIIGFKKSLGLRELMRKTLKYMRI